MQAVCYSKRLLNPYRGIVSVIELNDANAFSIDGVHWRLHVTYREPVNVFAGFGLDTDDAVDVKYADWSERDGLQRVPLNPLLDFDYVQFLGEQLHAAVEKHAPGIPFDPQDNYELWLLDKTRQPLALLKSARCKPVHVRRAKPRWQATGLRDHSFISRHCDMDSGSGIPRGAWCRDLLTRQVNNAAGVQPAAQWFLRNPDDSGTALADESIDAELTQRILPNEAFPELLLREDWTQEQDAVLVKDYFYWQSPMLLLLTHLADSRRALLEKAACSRAVLVAAYYRLFPKVIDGDAVNAALVESMLRATSGQQETAEENSMPVYYVEI